MHSTNKCGRGILDSFVYYSLTDLKLFLMRLTWSKKVDPRFSFIIKKGYRCTEN